MDSEITEQAWRGADRWGEPEQWAASSLAQSSTHLSRGDTQAQAIHSRALLPTVHLQGWDLLRGDGVPVPPPTQHLPPPWPYLGQVPEDQQVPLGGPLGHPLPLSSHILILLLQGWQQSRFGSEGRQVNDPGKDASHHHPHLVPTDCGRRRLRCWSRSVMRRNRGPWATMARRFLPMMSQRRGDWNCLSPVGTGRTGSCPPS